MSVLAVGNLKGGVGKTTVAVNLAHAASRQGYRCALWDLDPQAAATAVFRVRPEVEGGARKLVRGTSNVDGLLRGSDFRDLDILPADLSYRNLDLHLEETGHARRAVGGVLSDLARTHDLVVLDCPPGMGLLPESLFRCADAVLVPVIPAPLVVRATERFEAFLAERDWAREKPPRILPFFNMLDRRKKTHRRIEDECRATGRFLVTVIPYGASIERMGAERAPVAVYDAKGRPAAAFRDLWAEVRARLTGS